MTTALFELRQHQRFVAQREDQARFWVSLGSERLPLQDISVEGFGLVYEAAFTLGQDLSCELGTDAGSTIRVRARIINATDTPTGMYYGCRFVSIDGADRDQLKEWLMTHVLTAAAVRITTAEAEQIVSGPSII